ncbi:MAG: alpha/beta fold hydrolase [Alphaproteobacteria bacterium]|nr:alpha/beta fold hydrolase [Alphaproteobacteria bacterium]
MMNATQFDKNGTAYQFFATQNPHENVATIVLIHGLGLNRQLWQWHVGALTQYFHVLCYDLYGHGDSKALPASPTITLPLLANQLSDLLDHIGIEKVVIAGFSIGGMINRRFAIDYPEKTIALLILNAPHQRKPEAQQAVEQRAIQSRSKGMMSSMDAALERWFTPEFMQVNDAICALIRDWRAQCNPDAYNDCYQVLAHGVSELIKPQPQITHPSLVITCQYDTGSTPEMSRAIANEIVGAQVAIVPALKHLGLIEQPKIFTGLMLSYLYKLLAIDV